MDFDEQEKMIVCLGEILVDFVSSESGCTLADAPGFLKAAGGAPANVAAGIAKLDHPSRETSTPNRLIMFRVIST